MSRIGYPNSMINQKAALRKGYTTGSCATAAAKAAAYFLLTGFQKPIIKIITPNNTILELKIREYQQADNWAMAAVQKDSGDDPDVTNGIMVYAKIELRDKSGIIIEGGKGIGRVTKAGLACGIGEAAINPVPRKMIENAVCEVLEELSIKKGALVTISIPEGEKTAEKTYNPRLGIVGGISVLGTTGIVEPMSELALLETIRLDMKVKRESGIEILVMTPGNYGEDYLRNKTNTDLSKAVKCSNFIGEALDYAKELGIKKILLVGHIGKLVKLAGGIMNTHSNNADCRLEILTAYAGISGASNELQQNIMDSITTDQAIVIIKEAGLLSKVMGKLIKRIDYHLALRTDKEVQTEVILFSTKEGFLARTKMAEEFLKESQIKRSEGD